MRVVEDADPYERRGKCGRPHRVTQRKINKSHPKRVRFVAYLWGLSAAAFDGEAEDEAEDTADDMGEVGDVIRDGKTIDHFAA